MLRSLLIKSMLVSLILLVLAWSVNAQQQFHLTQYMMNPYIINPAVGGTEADFDFRAGSRLQWVSFPGAPKTYYFTGNARFEVMKKPNPLKKLVPFHSLGGTAYKDEAGPIKRVSALGSYSYNIPLSKNLNMALGVSAGFVNIYFDYSMLEFDQDGERFDYNNKIMPDGNIGTWLYNRFFFLGFSINQLFSNELNLVKDYSDADQSSRLVHHFYLTNGYNIPLGFGQGKSQLYDYYLVPSFLIKYAGKNKPSVDLNLKVKKGNLLWIGASYRKGDAFAFLGGLTLFSNASSSLEAGYSYDRTISALRGSSYGSHEIQLVYKMKGKTRILCPDNFW